MNIHVPYYYDKIKSYFELKQSINPRYSLRALARDLNLAPGTLSLALQKKRSLTPKVAELVADKMNLSAEEKELFLESLKTKLKIDSIKTKLYNNNFVIDNSEFKVIAEWEHYAVLTLFDLDEFDPTAPAIASRLNISLARSHEVIKNLIASGLLAENEGILSKVHSNIRTTETIKSRALRASHKENINLASEKIDQIKMEFRDFSSIMMAINTEQIPHAKTIIREFRMKMESLLEQGSRGEIYQLAIQFYPLTYFPESIEVKNDD